MWESVKTSLVNFERRHHWGEAVLILFGIAALWVLAGAVWFAVKGLALFLYHGIFG